MTSLDRLAEAARAGRPYPVGGGSSIRGRIVKVGGVAQDAGASARTEQVDNTVLTRPAYRVSQGQMQPAGVGGAAGGTGPLLDLSNIAFWRLLVVGAAALYVGLFHFQFSPRGVAAGVRL